MLNPNIDIVDLSLSEYRRYSRHLVLPQVQLAGQKRLSQAKIVCIGAGGLGSPLVLYLAASGVGHITIIDYDTVDLSNLQRQIIHNTNFIDVAKTKSAKHSANKLNPNCKIETHQIKLDKSNAINLLHPYDLVIDGTDNIHTRFLIDECCSYLSKPWIYGAIFQFEGQVTVFNFKGGPKYRDIYPITSVTNSPVSCPEGGVLGVLPGIIGLLQAIEVLKILLGIGEILSGRILTFDTLTLKFKEINIRHDLSLNAQNYYAQQTELDCSLYDSETAITSEELNLLIKRDLVYLIDVRSKIEYRIEHIPTAVNYSLAELDNILLQDHLNNISKQIVVYCSLDSRSIIAAEKFKSLQIHNYRLKNGFNGWKQLYKNQNTY